MLAGTEWPWCKRSGVNVESDGYVLYHANSCGVSNLEKTNKTWMRVCHSLQELSQNINHRTL